MVTYPEDWREEMIEDIFSVITDYVAAGSFADLSQNVVYLKSPDYAQLVRTKDIKSKFTNNDFVYISKSAYEYLWRVHFDKPIIIMPNIGNCGEVYYLEPHMLPYKNSALGPNAIMLKKTTHDMKFLSYALERDDFQSSLADITSPSGQTKFNKTALAKISIVIPECFSEQQAIASVLSDFDEHIDNLSELIEKKKAIRDGALEDLVSGRTRLDGFNDEWNTVSFNQVIKPKARIGWQGLKKDEYLRSGYSYLIGGTDFHNGTVNLDNISYVSKERYDMDSNIQVESNNVLVTKDGTIGKVALVPKLDRPATLNSGVFVFRTTSSLLPIFLYRVLLSSVFREFINTLSAGSTIKHLYQKDLSNFEFKIPQDTKEQEAIALILTAMDDEIESLKIEKEKMLQIKEGAMDDLLTGRVRLKV